MKYAFFIGCTMAYRLPFAEKSVRMVTPHFDIELVDLPFTCCPEPNGVRSFSDDTWLVFAARNIMNIYPLLT
jgi:heterodisulfide reductase subunit B